MQGARKYSKMEKRLKRKLERGRGRSSKMEKRLKRKLERGRGRKIRQRKRRKGKREKECYSVAERDAIKKRVVEN
jgi:hypothetical protein